MKPNPMTPLAPVSANPATTRRGFIGGSAVAAGSLVIGFHVPFGSKAMAQGAMPANSANASATASPNTSTAVAPEVNAWVVVRPDDTVVIRVARTEMGQGTLTGLAQLVAEELECDWAKVSTECPTPGQNLPRPA